MRFVLSYVMLITMRSCALSTILFDKFQPSTPLQIEEYPFSDIYVASVADLPFDINFKLIKK